MNHTQTVREGGEPEGNRLKITEPLLQNSKRTPIPQGM